MGILTYVLLQIAYNKFYGSFGVSLDELGIGYTQLLSQGAIGFAILLILSVLSAGFSVFLWGALIGDLWQTVCGSNTLGRLWGLLRRVQRMLSHASAAMTMDVYSGLFDDDLGGLVERMDAAHGAHTSSRTVGAVWARDPIAKIVDQSTER